MQLKLKQTCCVIWLACAGLASGSGVIAQEVSFADAKTGMAAAQKLIAADGLEATNLDKLEQIRRILDGIVQDFPASDVAVRILFQDTIGNLDVAALDAILANPPKASETVAEVAPQPEPEAEATPVEDAPEEPKPLPDERFSADLRDFGKALHQCYTLDPVETLPEPMRVTFRLGDDGLADGLPEKIAPDSNEPAFRRAFLQAAFAIDACLPFPGAAQNAEYEIEITTQGITALIQAGKTLAPPERTYYENADRFDPELREFGVELHKCYIRDGAEDLQTMMTVAFKIGAAGNIEGLPERLSPKGNDPVDRRAFFDAIGAMDTCGPYPADIAGKEYTATFSKQGLYVLKTVEPRKPSWQAATKETQAELEFKRSDIAEIQARLEANGLDPNGVDGVFGGGTQKALRLWQEDNEMPVTGYFDAPQYAEFQTDTEEKFTVWAADTSNANRLASASKARSTQTTTRKRGSWYRDSSGRYCRKLAIGTWCQVNRPRNL